MSGNVKKMPMEFDPVRMLRLVSRTFALGIEQLPGELREPITIAYLMLRVSDYLEDNEVMEPDRKVELLHLWVDVMRDEAPVASLTSQLTDVDPDDAEAEVARNADAVLRRLHDLPVEVQEHILGEVIQSTLGMARWQARGPVIPTEEDLDDYMFEVAGRVGLMLTRIFGWYAPAIEDMGEQLMPLAREFGLALQTVNIVRNMREDFERGWIFAPESFCKRAGLDLRQDLFSPENVDRALQVVGMLADKAERHSRMALAYVKMIPGRYHRIRLFCLWPLLFAIRTLAISRGNSSVLETEAKISREEVMKIIEDTRSWDGSYGWLDTYLESLKAG